MASQLMERLDRALEQVDDPYALECLKAERAGALARHGFLADARFIIAGVRTQNQRHKAALLAAWVEFVEGLIAHFESLTPNARMHFEHARELAVQAGDAPMRALAAAWSANSAFNAFDLEVMPERLIEALRYARSIDHLAHARIGLVLAAGFMYGGDEATAQQWYRHAHQHASADGDGSMISVLLHNKAAMTTANLVFQDAMGHGLPEEAGKVLIEIDSAAHYDMGVGTNSLVGLVPVLRAQALAVAQRYEEAIAVFDISLKAATQEGNAHRNATYLADLAYCYCRCGRQDRALHEAQQVLGLLSCVSDPDDRATAYGRLASVYAGCGQPELAERHAALAQAAFHDCQHSRARMLSAVRRVLHPPR